MNEFRLLCAYECYDGYFSLHLASEEFFTREYFYKRISNYTPKGAILYDAETEMSDDQMENTDEEIL